MNGRDFPPVHPGETLLEEFLNWMNLQTPYELELARDLSASTIDR
jgi:plasmid maintenance system antidote protein VapI